MRPFFTAYVFVGIVAHVNRLGLTAASISRGYDRRSEVDGDSTSPAIAQPEGRGIGGLELQITPPAAKRSQFADTARHRFR